MDYFPPLDAFFDSPWLSVGSFVLYCLLLFIFRKPLFAARRGKPLLGFLYAAIGFAWLMVIIFVNPMFWGYGRSLEIVDARWDADGIVLVDYRTSGGDETSDPTPHYRVHLIDPATGRRRHRFLIGWLGKLEWLESDRVVCKTGRETWASFSRMDGTRIASVDRRSLPPLFEELSAGLKEIKADARARRLEILALDGRRWTLDGPLSAPRPWEPAAAEQSPPLRFDERTLYAPPDPREPALALWSEAAEPQRSILWGEGRRTGAESPHMIDAAFAAASLPGSWAIVLHWKSIERRAFILSAYDLSGRPLWKTAQSELMGKEGPGDVIVRPSPDGTRVLVCAGKRAVCLDARDGKALWSLVP